MITDVPNTGTTVLVAPYLLHRDPRAWPQPDRFRPQRWRALLAEREADRGGMLPAMSLLSNMQPNGHYAPFGAGPRNCVGTGFAMVEVLTVLAGLLQQWELQPPGPGAPFPQPAALITLRPAAVELMLVPRS